MRDPKGELHGEWGKGQIHSTAGNSQDSEGVKRRRSRCVRSLCPECVGGGDLGPRRIALGSIIPCRVSRRCFHRSLKFFLKDGFLEGTQESRQRLMSLADLPTLHPKWNQMRDSAQLALFSTMCVLH